MPGSRKAKMTKTLKVPVLVAHLQILYGYCWFNLDMNYKCGQGCCNKEVRLVCNTCGEDVDINARFR